jgi:hypothetical protein
MAKTSEALLEEMRLLREEQFRISQAVRALVKETIRPLSEEVKYGGILFSSGLHFGGVFAHNEHVSVEFGHGASIADPEGLLEGGGKGRRHIKLRSISDTSVKKLAKYVPLALDAARRSVQPVAQPEAPRHVAARWLAPTFLRARAWRSHGRSSRLGGTRELGVQCGHGRRSRRT